MNLHEFARCVAVAASVLIAFSLLLTGISWHLGFGLFAACQALYILAWVLEGGAVKQQLSATIPK